MRERCFLFNNDYENYAFLRPLLRLFFLSKFFFPPSSYKINCTSVYPGHYGFNVNNCTPIPYYESKLTVIEADGLSRRTQHRETVRDIVPRIHSFVRNRRCRFASVTLDRDKSRFAIESRQDRSRYDAYRLRVDVAAEISSRMQNQLNQLSCN